MHSEYRLELTEYIEQCLRQVVDQFPGFLMESVMAEEGWGTAVRRDDLGLVSGGGRENFYSRLELVVRPYSQVHVLELATKGTIRNKEIYNRNQYQRLGEIDLDSFKELIDLWVLEYAERFAAA